MVKSRTHYSRLPQIIILLAFLLATLAGCSQQEESVKAPPEKKAAASTIVAQVGDGVISADELKTYLNTFPQSHQRQVTISELEKRLDKMILEEVLFQEALRLNIDQHPDVRRRYRTLLTQKLMDEQVNRKQWNREVPDTELKAYYDENRAKFNRPAQVRIADIFINLPEGTAKAQKAVLQKKAAAALAEAHALKGQRAGFSRLVRKYSSPHTLYGKNATGFFDTQGQPGGIDKQLAEAAFRLDKVGSIAEQVIATPEGLHVIMLVGKRAALNRPLEAVKNQIKRVIQRDGVEKARPEFIEALKDRTEIKVDHAMVAAVHAELAQARPGKPEGAGRPQAKARPGMAPPATQ